MKTKVSKKKLNLTRCALAVATSLVASHAYADAVTDWNLYTALATKGATSTTAGVAGNAQNSNVSTRIAAIEARAVFDAVNAVSQFSPGKGYYYIVGATGGSAAAAAAQAAHDVLVGTLPASLSGTGTGTRTWLDAQLATDLSNLGVISTDPGVIAGQNAAAAALAARVGDYSAIRTTYIPSSNISSTGTATATGNPGIGLWRPNNGGAGVVDANTGAPAGFDATGAIVPGAAIDFNWKNVTPFSLSTLDKQKLVALVPPVLKVGSAEYTAELAFVQSHGQDFSAATTSRTGDQLLQALYYKSDAELFANQVARQASADRNLSLVQNAKLFAALDSALADARIAAFQAKYDLDYWRPITAINADATGNAATITWKPLATTPAHPSAPAGHSTTIAAGVEILRAFFQSDNIVQAGSPVTLTGFSWLVGTNNGTGKLTTTINGKDATTRDVSTFTQLQLENGRSRIYLGVHFPNDDYQGQILGVSVADQIINAQLDPAISGLSVYKGSATVGTGANLRKLFVNNSSVSGFTGL